MSAETPNLRRIEGLEMVTHDQFLAEIHRLACIPGWHDPLCNTAQALVQDSVNQTDARDALLLAAAEFTEFDHPLTTRAAAAWLRRRAFALDVAEGP